MNLALKDIRHGLFRFVLTCFGLGLLMTVVLAMIGIYNGLVADALAVVKAPAADVWVVEAGTKGPFAEASSIPVDTRDTVARMPGVAEAGAINYQTVEASFQDRTLRLYVIGYEPGRPGGPQTIAEGRGIGTSHFELVADRKTGLLPGDTIRLGRNRFTVVGLVEGAIVDLSGRVLRRFTVACTFIDAYAEKYGNFNVQLTGGDTLHFAPLLKNMIFADPQLIFKGLYAISEFNR